MMGFWSRLKKLAPQTVRSVPQTATTVLCTPHDWRDGRPKRVEQFSSTWISAYCRILLGFFNPKYFLLI